MNLFWEAFLPTETELEYFFMCGKQCCHGNSELYCGMQPNELFKYILLLSDFESMDNFLE